MESGPSEPFPTFSHVPYTKRWEPLKPYIEQLYLQDRRSLEDVVDLMKGRHKFYASESQYKRYFSIWGWKRNIPASKKDAICKEIQTRAQLGKASKSQYKGYKVDNTQIRRHVKTKARQNAMGDSSLALDVGNIELLFGHALQCGRRVFMNWDTPYLNRRDWKAAMHPTTPASDVLVTTPSPAVISSSPRSPNVPGASPRNEPSPTTVAVLNGVKLDRTRLFIQGQTMELLQGMSRHEKNTMVNWLYDFWLFSFKTAKCWNRGPLRWNASMLGSDESLRTMVSSPAQTPRYSIESPSTSLPRQHVVYEIPTTLCRWSIHVREIRYKRVDDPLTPDASQENIDPNDEATWQPWAVPQPITHFAEVLESSLESNQFSNIETNSLPISSSQVLKAIRKSPEDLLYETFGFAIMAHNLDLVESMLEGLADRNHSDLANSGIYPLHLAASYLSGSETCCNILITLMYGMPTGEASARKLYVNHLGHTVLDSLMITILKSHTSCSPHVVDDAFKMETRFAGEEVDICGRWDADSKCIRNLYAQGQRAIPFEWKHAFCHTSVQAICHSIDALFLPRWGPDINTPSGLFVRRCANESCGQKLQLLPLHTLVVTTVHLATQGCEGETLFGMIACLLCMISLGANPTSKAAVSVNALLGHDDDNYHCSHVDLDPVDLVENVPHELISQWPNPTKTGWKIFYHVLKLSRAQWQPLRSQVYTRHMERDSDSEVPVSEFQKCDEDIEIFFGNDRNLISLWRAVQAEFMTYRRINEGESWISPYFNMESLLRNLDSGCKYGLGINLIENGMIEPEECLCGRLHHYKTAVRDDICGFYFSNMEDWHRTSFIHSMDLFD
ncbi:hypothetical protein F5884DRAFT_832254 [Xylogone sp. PMI_703]|nr:hypothetical protein F5884DRAFT_832254 [Xylogone sp. PMI_703]